jgi:hypothetical protein
MFSPRDAEELFLAVNVVKPNAREKRVKAGGGNPRL